MWVELLCSFGGPPPCTSHLLAAQGKHGEVESLYNKRSMAVDKEAHGPEPPKVAADLYGWALLSMTVLRRVIGSP